MGKKRTGDNSKIGMRVGTKRSIDKGKSDQKGVIKKGGGCNGELVKEERKKGEKTEEWMRGRGGEG